jgi:hypothetical protein
LVVILCIIFFPVGLYALWKNQFISKGWKIGVSIFFLFLVLGQIGNTEKYFKNEQELTNTTRTQNQDQSEEGYTPPMKCIGENEAKDRVSANLKQQVLEGTLDASWMPNYWQTEKQSNGWLVEAYLNFTDGGSTTITYFVSCDGQVQ